MVKKLLGFLEQNVQWMVLLVGIAYALFMAWTYLINPPVSGTVQGEKLSPGQIDKVVFETKATELDQRLRRQVPVAIPPQQSYAATFRDSMNYQNDPAKPLSASMVILPVTPLVAVVDIRPETPVEVQNAPGGAPHPLSLNGIAALPDVSTAQPRITDWRSGMSQVAPPPPRTEAGTPPAPAAAPGAEVAVTGIDKTWVTVRYEIDPALLSKAWDQVKMADRDAMTSVLQIVLERQEKKSDAGWSEATVVPPLSFSQLETLPEANTASNQTLDYRKWAGTHQADLLQPLFYTVVKGDLWAPPGVDLPNAPTQQKAAFDPKQYLAPGADVHGLTNEQKQAVYAERAKQKRPARGAPAGGRRGPAPQAPLPAPAPAAEPAPRDLDRPISYQAKNAEPAAADPVDVPETPAIPPGKPATAGPQIPKAKYDQFPLPSGEFDPRKWGAEHTTHPLIVGWAHDETVEPGHVYRYRITYKLKNPVFFANTAVKDPKLADIFSLPPIVGAWSDEVSVASPISFWLVRGGINNNSMSIKVFRRFAGEIKAKVFEVTPGDTIGGKDGDVDFSTSWTLVDVRRDSKNEPYVLLMDKFGTVSRRDLRADSADPKFIEMNSAAGGSASAAKPADAVAGAK